LEKRRIRGILEKPRGRMQRDYRKWKSLIGLSKKRGPFLSLATELLRSGASLTEIGQVLRHQQQDSTRIYAKVDLNALRQLGLPWPGGVQ
jgi:site-specific recombinase XerD